MREVGIHLAKATTIHFIRASKWLWKVNKFLWATLIFAIVATVAANILTSSLSLSLTSTPLGKVLQYPIFIVIILGGLLILNAIIYFGSRLDVGLSNKELKRLYLRRLIQETAPLALTGFPSGLVSSGIPLDEVFIPLQFYQLGLPTDSLLEMENKEKETVSLIELWQQLTKEHPVAVIQGLPGAGKTMLLKRLTLHMARRSLGQSDPTMLNNLAPPLIPIFLRVVDFARAFEMYRNINFSILDYLKLRDRWIDIPGSDSFLEESLNSGRCLVMFDGLDEVRDIELKKGVEKAIQVFTDKYRDLPNKISSFNRFLITSHVAGYDDSNFGKYKQRYLIQDLTNLQVGDFLKRWFRVGIDRNMVNPQKEMFTESAQMAQSLIDTVKKNQRLQELVRIPLFLTLLVAVYQKGLIIPKRRAELLTLFISMQLESRDIAKHLPPIHEDLAIHRLGPIAFKMQESENMALSGEEVVYLLTQSILSEKNPPDQVEQEVVAFLNRISEQSSIFVQHTSDLWGFSHRSIQEYFVARYILDEIKNDPDYWLAKFIKSVSHDDDHWLWHEPFLLAVSYASSHDSILANRILEALLDNSPKDDLEGEKRDVFLAVKCLIDAEPYTIGRELEERIAEQLLSLYQQAQQSQYTRICIEIEDVVRRWQESVPEHAFRPVLPMILQEAANNQLDSTRQQDSLALLKTISEPSDDELVEKSLGGDIQAFEMLLERYRNWIYTIARNTGNGSIAHDEALDIVQEVFLKVWNNLANFKREDRQFKSWLRRITEKTTIDALRKKRKSPPSLAWDDLQSKGEEHDLSIESSQDEVDENDYLDKLLAMLPPKEHLCFELHLQGYSHEEIAEQVEIKVSSVPVYISQARKKLQNFHRIMR